MKIAIYQIVKVYPQNEDHEEFLLDIVNMPSLKYGYIRVLGEHSVEKITKPIFKKIKLVAQRYYNPASNSYLEGFLDSSKFEFIVVL